MLQIHGMSINVLLDTSVSYFFISRCLIDKFNLKHIYLVTSLRIANPIGWYATPGLKCDQLEFDMLGQLLFAVYMYLILWSTKLFLRWIG